MPLCVLMHEMNYKTLDTGLTISLRVQTDIRQNQQGDDNGKRNGKRRESKRFHGRWKKYRLCEYADELYVEEGDEG